VRVAEVCPRTLASRFSPLITATCLAMLAIAARLLVGFPHTRTTKRCVRTGNVRRRTPPTRCTLSIAKSSPSCAIVSGCLSEDQPYYLLRQKLFSLQNSWFSRVGLSIQCRSCLLRTVRGIYGRRIIYIITLNPKDVRADTMALPRGGHIPDKKGRVGATRDESLAIARKRQ
jgi:hypothetical protein